MLAIMCRVALVAGALMLGAAGPLTADPATAGPAEAGATQVGTTGPAGDPLRILRSGGYHPVPPAEGYEYPDCYCTDSEGARVEIGATSCLVINSEPYFAKCDMSLNSPIWRRLHKGCPIS